MVRHGLAAADRLGSLLLGRGQSIQLLLQGLPHVWTEPLQDGLLHLHEKRDL
jgi:hypothetical protein